MPQGSPSRAKKIPAPKHPLNHHPNYPAMTCIFCTIVAGDAPGRIIHETDDTIAFLDANPLCPGHTLVVPKTHYERLNDVPTTKATSLMHAITTILDPIETALDAPATTIAFNNGRHAGQEVPHVHAHIIPRSPEDGGGPIHAAFRSRPSLTDQEMDHIHDQITTQLTDSPE